MKCQSTFNVLIFSSIALNASATFGQIMYVDASNQNPGNGSTWATARSDLQDAIDYVYNNLSSYTEIRVAQGSYKPDGADPGSRTLSFHLLDRITTGFEIRGGYQGIAGLPDHADDRGYETILSGDLNGDDPADLTDNSYTVVRGDDPGANPVGSTSRLDGFTITGAYNDDSLKGGGVFLPGDSSPRLVNCRRGGTVRASKLVPVCHCSVSSGFVTVE